MTVKLNIIPVPDLEKDLRYGRRVIDQNFSRLRDVLMRAIADGDLVADGSITLAMLAAEVLANSGDVSGTHPAHTVVGLNGKTLAAPTVSEDDKVIGWNHSGDVWEYLDHGGIGGLTDDDHPQYKMKTGWDLAAYETPLVTVTIATRTVSLAKVSADVNYWIGGVKYTLSTTKQVTFDNTEGVWYIYLVGDTLTASQTPWAFDNTKCFVASLYWDATNGNTVGFAHELHTWEITDRLHEYLHETFGTRWHTGLAVSENPADQLEVTAGEIYDEDIEVIITDAAGSGWWDQALSPLSAPIYYRSGASGYWRKIAASTTPCYLDTNVLQYNDPNAGGAGVWGLSPVTNNQYVAYWVIASTNNDDPVYLVPGQEDGANLAAARDGNQISAMLFGNLPTAEHKVIARVLIQRIAGSPYYSVTEIADYRNIVDEPNNSAIFGDHGGLTGLGDDDHTHYSRADGTRAFTGVVEGVTPTANAHLATKLYVDTAASASAPPDDFDLLTNGVDELVFAGGDVVWIT